MRNVFKNKIGYEMGNKYDVGDVVFLTRYDNHNKLHIYKTIVLDVEKEVYCPLECYNVWKTQWKYSLKGIKGYCDPRIRQEELFKAKQELFQHYVDLAKKDMENQNKAWDTQEEYTCDQIEYTDFGIKLVCKVERCKGAWTEEVIDYTKKGENKNAKS